MEANATTIRDLSPVFRHFRLLVCPSAAAHLGKRLLPASLMRPKCPCAMLQIPQTHHQTATIVIRLHQSEAKAARMVVSATMKGALFPDSRQSRLLDCPFAAVHLALRPRHARLGCQNCHFVIRAIQPMFLQIAIFAIRPSRKESKVVQTVVLVTLRHPFQASHRCRPLGCRSVDARTTGRRQDATGALYR